MGRVRGVEAIWEIEGGELAQFPGIWLGGEGGMKDGALGSRDWWAIGAEEGERGLLGWEEVDRGRY